jgi:hypothetical protein
MMSDVVSDVVASVEKLRASDGLVTDTGQQLNEIEAIADTITVLQSVLVDRLDEAGKVGATAEHYGRSPRRWLTEDVLMAGAEASRLVDLAKWLGDFPLTREAFRSARLSAAHAIEIVKGLRHLPPEYRDQVEPRLVDYAFTCRPEEIAAFIDALLDALGLDKASDVRRERRFAERGIDVGHTMDGQRTIVGTLTPEVGEKLAKALALAAVKTGVDDDRTMRQRQHDALGDLADSYLAHQQTPSFNGAPRTVIITMDLETLENQLREKWFTLPDGAQISAATARRLVCDAEIIPVVLGGRGEVLDIGQADREFTVPIRRAAYLRDRGRCAFPDCRGNVAELHHIVFPRHNGPTSLSNAAWLCAFHHWLVHEGGWSLHRDPVDNAYLWTGPHGQHRTRKLGTA